MRRVLRIAGEGVVIPSPKEVIDWLVDNDLNDFVDYDLLPEPKAKPQKVRRNTPDYQELFSRTVLTKDTISTLRKGYLNFIKGFRGAENYDDLMDVADGANLWAAQVENYIKLFAKEVKKLKSSPKRTEGEKFLADSWFDTQVSNLRKASHRIRLAIPRVRFADDYWSPETCFDDFNRNSKRLINSAAKDARDVWKLLDDFIKAVDNSKLEVKAFIPKRERTEIDGIKAIIFNFRDDRPKHRTILAKTKAAITDYKDRADKVFPLLLEKQIPIEIDFRLKTDVGGRYYKDKLAVYPVIPTKKELVKILAHEMGHHIYQTVMNYKQREFWNAAVKGDVGELDLRYALEKMEDRRWRKKYPVLKLQINSLEFNPAYKHLGLSVQKGIERYLKSGGDPIIKVNMRPISAYAGANPQEAFCDAVGLLVAYGPRKIPENARYWLNVIFPGKVRTAEVEE